MYIDNKSKQFSQKVESDQLNMPNELNVQSRARVYMRNFFSFYLIH